MIARPRHALALVLAGVAALAGLACDHKGEAEAPDEKTASRAEAQQPFASPPPRDLATLQRELAAQESELRRLGVLAEAESEPVEELEEAPAEQSAAERSGGRRDKGKLDTKTTETKKREKKQSPSKAGGAKAKDGSRVPGSAPRPASDGDAAGSPDPSAAIDESIGGTSEGTPAPEAAKSVQAPPRDQPNQHQQLRAEERCPLICSLAENTCELAEEICSLAEQHGDDSEYSGACERASDDCKQAQEACLECHG